MQLKYKVRGQLIQRQDNKVPVSGSQNYLEMVFDFTKDWLNTIKYIYFKVGTDVYEEILVDNKVMVPYVVTNNRKFQFWLKGYNNNGTEDVTDDDVIITTNTNNYVELLRNPGGGTIVQNPIKADEITLTLVNDVMSIHPEWLAELDKKLEDINPPDLSQYALKTELPTKVSELENDSNFLTSENLKTINGQSIVGEGDMIIEGGSDIITNPSVEGTEPLLSSITIDGVTYRINSSSGGVSVGSDEDGNLVLTGDSKFEVVSDEDGNIILK